MVSFLQNDVSDGDIVLVSCWDDCVDNLSTAARDTLGYLLSDTTHLSSIEHRGKIFLLIIRHSHCLISKERLGETFTLLFYFVSAYCIRRILVIPM